MRRAMAAPMTRSPAGRHSIAVLSESSGTKDDGNSTVGILAVSKSYYSLSGLRFANFSARGLQVKQCVFPNDHHHSPQQTSLRVYHATSELVVVRCCRWCFRLSPRTQEYSG